MNVKIPPAKIPDEVFEKFEKLQSFIRPLIQDGLIVAFSGGLDSAFLLWTSEKVRREFGGRLLAVTAVSASMAQVERDDARSFATKLGVEHRWEQSEEVSNPLYASNSGDRCYHCKSELFRIGFDLAGKLGFGWLAYGYNASDKQDVRPGHKAAQEKGVLAPLAEAGLTKDDIRIVMRAYGLDLSEKPASPCLSSRLMTGVRVTESKLNDVESMEKILRAAGVKVFRVRLHEEKSKFFRIEVDPKEMSVALSVREELIRESKARGYAWVALDLAGYRMGGGV